MFDKNLFPTPESVAAIMLQGLRNLRYKSILEPSAGKGDLLRAIQMYSLRQTGHIHSRSDDSDIAWAIKNNGQKSLYAIEKNTQLYNMLQADGWAMIARDFLTYQADRAFDLIIMNPPFDHGAKHLIHAMTIEPYAEVRCLLNTETLSNPYTEERKLLLNMMGDRTAMLDGKGEVQVKDLGQAFRQSERTTGVNVSLVIVPGLPREKMFHFDTSKIQSQGYIAEVKDFNAGGAVETSDVIESLLHRYAKATEIARTIKELQSELHFWADGLMNRTDLLDNLTKETFRDFQNVLRENSWSALFGQTKLADLVTNKVREQIEQEQIKTMQMAFSRDNIGELLLSLKLSQGKIMENCIEGAFDTLTQHHKGNRVHKEGWVTTSAFEVKSKVILHAGSWINQGDEVQSFDSGFVNRIADVEKALCMVAGKVPYHELKKQARLMSTTGKVQTGEKHDTHFFTFQMHKKGSVHIWFKDKELLKRFNARVFAIKKWLKTPEESKEAGPMPEQKHEACTETVTTVTRYMTNKLVENATPEIEYRPISTPKQLTIALQPAPQEK